MRRRTLTPRGAACLAIGVVCVVVANMFAAPILIYVGSFFLLATLIAALAVLLPRRSGTVTRQISTDLLTVGEPSRIRVRLDLRAIRTPEGIWRDELPAAVEGVASGEFPPENGPAGITYDIAGVRRGTWAIGPLTLCTMDPFGLVRREQAFGEVRTVTVVPSIVPLAPLNSAMGAAGGTAHTSSTRLGEGTDNLSPRKYVSGDSMRRIHWRATAHRGDLMVRQEEQESSPDAVVVLDRSADRWARVSDAADPHFEAAVSACASVAIHLVHEGYSVDVYDSAGEQLGALRGHEDDRDSLLVALALVSPRREARDLSSVIGGMPPGPLVYITGTLDTETAALLHPRGAAAPILLACELPNATREVLAGNGWTSAAIVEDVQSAWEDALPTRTATGGGHVPR